MLDHPLGNVPVMVGLPSQNFLPVTVTGWQGSFFQKKNTENGVKMGWLGSSTKLFVPVDFHFSICGDNILEGKDNYVLQWQLFVK
jgi:hypothetical protein